jgi:hypothetical protein
MVDLDVIDKKYKVHTSATHGDYRGVAKWLRESETDITLDAKDRELIAEAIDPQISKKRGIKRTMHQQEFEEKLLSDLAFIVAVDGVSESKTIGELAEEHELSDRTIHSYIKKNRAYYEQAKKPRATYEFYRSIKASNLAKQ